jgi:hypothetical protein
MKCLFDSKFSCRHFSAFFFYISFYKGVDAHNVRRGSAAELLIHVGVTFMAVAMIDVRLSSIGDDAS